MRSLERSGLSFYTKASLPWAKSKGAFFYKVEFKSFPLPKSV